MTRPWAEEQAKVLARLVGRVRDIRRFGSAALDLVDLGDLEGERPVRGCLPPITRSADGERLREPAAP